MALKPSILLTVIACAVAASSDLAGSSGDRYVEVGAKELSMPTRIVRTEKHHDPRGDRRAQWFGANLGAPEGAQPEDSHHEHAHLQRGFNLDEVFAERGRQMKSHIHKHTGSLEEGGQHQRIRANAGIPILQASKTKSERDNWPRDVEDPEPGDGYEGPRDVENNPGDALLEVEASEEEPSVEKPSLLRRELASQYAGDAFTEMDGTPSTCDQCKNCNEAEPNKPDPANHSDGVWCMCSSWTEWSGMQNSPGIYPGQSELCNPNVCTKNMAVWDSLKCDSLNCSCDLNIFWEPYGDVHGAGHGKGKGGGKGSGGG